jgi:hypothetical protein
MRVTPLKRVRVAWPNTLYDGQKGERLYVPAPPSARPMTWVRLDSGEVSLFPPRYLQEVG